MVSFTVKIKSIIELALWHWRGTDSGNLIFEPFSQEELIYELIFIEEKVRSKYYPGLIYECNILLFLLSFNFHM